MPISRTQLGILFISLVLFVSSAHAAALVNINTATESQLETLKGIGPSKAAAILDYRSSRGAFARTEDIQQVKGIGPATFANMQASITVGDATVPTSPQASREADQSVGSAKQKSAPSTVQPAPQEASSNKVQAEVVSSSTNAEDDTQEALAPAEANDLAAAGAAAPAPAGPFSSVWFLGLIGVVVFAGGAFILL